MWRKVLGLSVLILVLSGGTWAAVYFWPAQDGKSNVETQASKADDAMVMREAESQIDPSQIDIELDIKEGEVMTNPIKVKGKVEGIDDLAGIYYEWKLENLGLDVIASGTMEFDVNGDIDSTGWYPEVQSDKSGYLEVAVKRSELTLAIKKIKVGLETRSQTAEIYFAPKRSQCGTVEAVKHDITAVTGSQDDFYGAVIRELIKGPTKEEGLKYETFIPSSTQIFFVIKDSDGRMAADFAPEMIAGADKCGLENIKKQIAKSLSYVARPGLTRDGVVYVNSTPIDAIMEDYR